MGKREKEGSNKQDQQSVQIMYTVIDLAKQARGRGGDGPSGTFGSLSLSQWPPLSLAHDLLPLSLGPA